MRFAKNQTAQRISVVFILALTSQLLNEHHGDMYHDAWGYLNLATKFIDTSGKREFNILNFDSQLRGYSFSVLLLPLLVVQSLTKLPLTLLTKLFGSVWAAVLVGGLMPELWKRLSRPSQQISWVGFLLFVVAFLLYWRDYLTFTLTDIPALTLLIGGILSLSKRGFKWWLLAGLCIAAAVNFRPVYTVALPIVGVLVVWLVWQSERYQRWLGLLGFVVGLGIVWLPQAYINYYRFGKVTPLVLGTRIEDNLRIDSKLNNLYIWHLNAGLVCEKYGPALVGVNPNLVEFVPDATGIELVASRNGQPIVSIGEYAAFAMAHPLGFFDIQVKHMFNLLDIDYPGIYVLRIQSVPVWYCFINYSLLFVGFLGLIGLPRPRSAIIIALLLALSASVLVCLPILTEPRFALPLHLLLIAAATMGVKPRLVQAYWRKAPYCYAQLLILLVGYALWISVAFSMHSKREKRAEWILPEAARQRYFPAGVN